MEKVCAWRYRSQMTIYKDCVWNLCSCYFAGVYEDVSPHWSQNLFMKFFVFFEMF